jgi:hypothetical protein
LIVVVRLNEATQVKEEATIQYRAKKGDKIDELIAQFLSETSGVYM